MSLLSDFGNGRRTGNSMRPWLLRRRCVWVTGFSSLSDSSPSVERSVAQTAPTSWNKKATHCPPGSKRQLQMNQENNILDPFSFQISCPPPPHLFPSKVQTTIPSTHTHSLQGQNIDFKWRASPEKQNILLDPFSLRQQQIFPPPISFQGPNHHPTHLHTPPTHTPPPLHPHTPHPPGSKHWLQMTGSPGKQNILLLDPFLFQLLFYFFFFCCHLFPFKVPAIHSLQRQNTNFKWKAAQENKISCCWTRFQLSLVPPPPPHFLPRF